MKIILADTNPRLVQAWETFFKDEPDVQVIEANITKLTADAIVSPANSFGFMDGGVDYAISEKLGWDLQKQLQYQIQALPEGELIVGTALVLETGNTDFPFLISAPTMRVPTNFNIHTSVNAYLAMKAALIKAKAHERINSIAIPGFCTGVGRMDVMVAAGQMHKAYNEIIKGERMYFKYFGEAQKYHRDINPHGAIYT